MLSRPAIFNPMYIRYAWADNPAVNLEDGDGYPAFPFRTDEFGVVS